MEEHYSFRKDSLGMMQEIQIFSFLKDLLSLNG